MGLGNHCIFLFSHRFLINPCICCRFQVSAQATRLLNAFKILDQAKTNGRKAHAQLLVSTDHDISHISKLERELADFEHTCRSIRGDLPIPDNTAEVRELLEKWTREEGPSLVLKAAVNGNDIATLREVGRACAASLASLAILQLTACASHVHLLHVLNSSPAHLLLFACTSSTSHLLIFCSSPARPQLVTCSSSVLRLRVPAHRQFW